VQFGLGSKARKVFTTYSVIRDKGTGQAIEGKAVMEGRLSKIAPDEYKRGDLMGNDYAINELTQALLQPQGKVLLGLFHERVPGGRDRHQRRRKRDPAHSLYCMKVTRHDS
jgi:hypothetical protein